VQAASFFKRPNIIHPKSSSKRASKKEMLKSFGWAITLWGRKLRRFKSICYVKSIFFFFLQKKKKEYAGPRRENVPSYLQNKMFQPMLDHQTSKAFPVNMTKKGVVNLRIGV
jgi:hypothetical protein